MLPSRLENKEITVLWFYKIGKPVVWPFWKLVYPMRVLGRENYPREGRVVTVCNHYSYTDPIHLIINLPREIRFIGKKELWNSRFLKWVLEHVGAIPVDRGNVGLSPMKQCLSVLKREEVLTLFPEGRRNKDNEELMELKGGMAVFAVMGKAPIVPMMLYRRPKLFQRNYLIIGEPIVLEEYYGRKLTEEDFSAIDARISAVLNSLRERVPEKFRAKCERQRQKALAKQQRRQSKKTRP